MNAPASLVELSVTLPGCPAGQRWTRPWHWLCRSIPLAAFGLDQGRLGRARWPPGAAARFGIRRGAGGIAGHGGQRRTRRRRTHEARGTASRCSRFCNRQACRPRGASGRGQSRAYLAERTAGAGSEAGAGTACRHRAPDRQGHSGLLVVARTLEAHTALVEALHEHEVQREYMALCVGALTGGGHHRQGHRPASHRPLRMAVRADGRPAITHYRIEERYASHTLLRVILETGRTHQIRVHLAHIGHPLVGDPLYGGRRQLVAGLTAEVRAALGSFPSPGAASPRSSNSRIRSAARPSRWKRRCPRISPRCSR